MRNRMYGGVRGRKTKVGRKLLRFPPTRLSAAMPRQPPAVRRLGSATSLHPLAHARVYI